MQSGYKTVRWDVVGRQKSTGSITNITKQKGDLVAEGNTSRGSGWSRKNSFSERVVMF